MALHLKAFSLQTWYISSHTKLFLNFPLQYWNFQCTGLTYPLLYLFPSILFLDAVVNIFFHFLIVCYQCVEIQRFLYKVNWKEKCWYNRINIWEKMNLDPCLNVYNKPKVKIPRTVQSNRTFCDDRNVLCVA